MSSFQSACPSTHFPNSKIVVSGHTVWIAERERLLRCWSWTFDKLLELGGALYSRSSDIKYYSKMK